MNGKKYSHGAFQILAVLFTFLPWSAGLRGATVEARGALDLTLAAFHQVRMSSDVDYLIAKKDLSLSEKKALALQSFGKTSLEVAPYTHSYKTLEQESLVKAHFVQKGIRTGITQTTPWGTQLQFQVDEVLLNTREGSLALDRGYSVSLVQPLWKNQLGSLQKEESTVALKQWESQSLLVESKLRAACLKSTGLFIDAWAGRRQERWSEETFKASEILFDQGQKALKKGQISQLDWLGLKAEHLNMLSLRRQSEVLYEQALMPLKIFFPPETPLQLRDPEPFFDDLAQEVQNHFKEDHRSPETGRSLEELHWEKAREAQEALWRWEQSKNRPELNLKVSQIWNRNSQGGIHQRESDQFVSLNLVWNFNDSVASVSEHQARLELDKINLKSLELRQLRQISRRNQKANFEANIQQMKIQQERILVLKKIYEESQKRFLQGRIEFQDLSRAKEQWISAQKSGETQRMTHWKALLSFAIEEQWPVSFCGEKP